MARVRAALRAARVLLALVLAVACSLRCAVCVQVPTAPKKALYIVRLRSAPPITGYRGGIGSYPATAPPAPDAADDGAVGNESDSQPPAAAPAPAPSAAHSAASTATWRNATGFAAASATPQGLGARKRRWKINPRLPHVRAFGKFLKAQQDRLAAEIGAKAVYNFKFASNSFAALLTPKQVWRLQRHPDVALVRRSGVAKRFGGMPSTSFLDLQRTTWAQAGGVGSAGDGVVVGVIDTGIWPEHKMFLDDGSFSAPGTWAGTCDATTDFPAALCTGKLVGARSFSSGFEAEIGARDFTDDYDSPRDSDSHGTWCAGAAVGNSGVTLITPFGTNLGAYSGVAPRANLAVYKVFWKTQGSSSASFADVEAALDQAMADGADVLSLSLGALDPSATYFDGVSYMQANLAGVTVVYAAGNSGRPPGNLLFPYIFRSVSNFSPFYLTVGASTINKGRTLSNSSALASELVHSLQEEGMVVVGNWPALHSTPVLLAAAAALPGASSTESARLCLPGSLAPAVVRGNVVVLMLVDHDDSAAMFALINALTAKSTGKKGGRRATTLSILDIFNYMKGPIVATFSSTGPLTPMTARNRGPYPTNHILKPDVIAPGVNLYSAAPGTSPNNAQMLSGTSMATPHVAGFAALIIQAHSDWTPAQVMSAIMTTARIHNSAGTPIFHASATRASPWHLGSGHINPQKVLDPGLTYNAVEADYKNFLAGRKMRWAKAMFPSDSLAPLRAYQLNRPCISVQGLQNTVVIVRRVTNVATSTSTYRAKVKQPFGVMVKVKPRKFTIAPGATQLFKVTLTLQLPWKLFRFGSLWWLDGKGHSVRIPIAVQPSWIR
ncbi:unnamed protein product [Closterium sp. NIES-64]|nr:unnamed protein product [Closterium sp. NIES-64]